MLKKNFIILFLITIFIGCLFVLTACASEGDVSIINVANATVDGATINMEVSSETSALDLSELITTAKKCSWKLYASNTATESEAIVTKTINLRDGLNTYYVVVSNEKNGDSKTYTLLIFKKYYVQIRFVAQETIISTRMAEINSTIEDDGPDCNVAGYSFNGWGCNGFKVIGAHAFYADLTPLSYRVTFDANGGEVSQSQQTVEYNKREQLPIPALLGYEFVGWTYSNQLICDKNAILIWNIADDIAVTAKWEAKNYSVYLNKNVSAAGTVSGDGLHKFKTQTTIRATIESGYTWLGWYDGATLLTDGTSYSFIMPAENLTYTAKYKSCPVHIEKNIQEAGSIVGFNGTIIGSQETIRANTNQGYTWLGWYDGETLLSNETSYTFTMLDNERTIVAKWELCPLSFEKNIEGAGSINSFKGAIIGAQETISATTYLGYVWEGWYNEEDVLLSNQSTYSFIMPESNTIITAKWSVSDEMKDYTFLATETTCEIVRINDLTKTEIIVPNYVTKIDRGAFAGCKYLVDITLPFAGISQDATGDDVRFGLIFTGTWTGSVAIKQRSLIYSNIDSIYVPATLRTVTITKGNINQAAFYGANILTTINLPIDCVSIGEEAFYECTGLESLTIPGSVTYIGKAAFARCHLYNVVVPDSMTYLPERMFVGGRLETITISKNVTCFGANALGGNVYLTKIVYTGTIDEWYAIQKGNQWNTSTGEYKIYCSDGILTKT